MTLPSKVYEILKFIVKFIPTVVAIISGLFGYIGIGDKTTTIVVFCVGAIGTIAQAIIEICKANHYKIQQTDGEIVPVVEYDVDEYETDENEDITEDMIED